MVKQNIINFVRIIVTATFIIVLCCAIFQFAIQFIVDVYSHSYGRTYETNDVADYGSIKGNVDNRSPNAFIFRFFPEKIEESFQNVTYHYKAIKGDASACEAYLEFTFEDRSAFDAHMATLPEFHAVRPFGYDQRYTEHIVLEEMYIDRFDGGTENEVLTIEEACIGKVLSFPEECRVIYIAIYIWDGRYTPLAGFTYYFDKFHIDPFETATMVLEGTLYD